MTGTPAAAPLARISPDRLHDRLAPIIGERHHRSLHYHSASGTIDFVFAACVSDTVLEALVSLAGER